MSLSSTLVVERYERKCCSLILIPWAQMKDTNSSSSNFRHLSWPYSSRLCFAWQPRRPIPTLGTSTGRAGAVVVHDDVQNLEQAVGFGGADGPALVAISPVVPDPRASFGGNIGREGFLEDAV
jgi:hypothetical protein